MKKKKKKVIRRSKKIVKHRRKTKNVINNEMDGRVDQVEKSAMPKTVRSIFDVEIKKISKIKERIKHHTRITSGIYGLDKHIQGGFKQGSINLIEGGPGSGKTIFVTQYLYEGLRRGEPVAYVTFEVMKEKFYENMRLFGWDLEKYEKQGLFYFLAYTPEQIKKILIEGGGTIDTLIHQKKIKRLVIDSITSFALLYANELAKKEAALTLFNIINNWSCTALLTAQDEGDVAHGEIVSAALDFEVDSIIILYHPRKRSIRSRGLEILKMRGTKTPEKIFNMDINKRGVVVKGSIASLEL